MYLINDGFCRVHVCDKNSGTGKMQDETIRVLEKGDYFGEVALIYDLRRTASVTSQNYCTLGKLSLKTLHSILSNFPHFRKSLIERTHKYDDSMKMFQVQALRKIEYLANSKRDTISTLAYRMKAEVLEKGAIIFKPQDISKCLFIIQDGLVELITTMDNGTEFIIETVGRGVALNQKTFLLEDELNLTARCHTTVTLFVIDKSNFTQAVGHDAALSKSLQDFLDDIIINEKHFELDITSVKDKVKTYNINKHRGFLKGHQALKAQKTSILFKNTVIHFLLKNRKERKVPKLGDILKLSIEQQKHQAKMKR